jgi:hypothetical protein
MRARRSLPQNSVGVFRNVFDLNTGHGAIMARNRQPAHGEPSGSADWKSLTSQEVRYMTICPPPSDSWRAVVEIARRWAQRVPLLPHVNMPATVFVASNAGCPRELIRRIV